MPKTGRQYGDELRQLREAGLDFPASRGYLLRNPAQWSVGLKSAVTRGINNLDAERPSDEPEGALDAETIEAFFDDAAGDAEEEFDDIDFFDFSEGEEFIDEESDQYEEDAG